MIPQINFRVLYLYNFILIAAFHFNVRVTMDFFFLFLALIVEYLIFMFNAYFILTTISLLVKHPEIPQLKGINVYVYRYRYR